jgi:hypothetical protein
MFAGTTNHPSDVNEAIRAQTKQLTTGLILVVPRGPLFLPKPNDMQPFVLLERQLSRCSRGDYECTVSVIITGF